MKTRWVVAAVSAAGLAITAFGGAAAGADVRTAESTKGIRCNTTPNEAFPDFNADGKLEIPIGVPGEDADTGRVEVNAGGDGIASYWHRGDNGDEFGSSMAIANINGDSCPDLLVGVPARTVDGKPNAGSVKVYYGRDFGIGPVYVAELVPGSRGIPGEPQANARFGHALAASDNQVFIGAPGRNVGDQAEAGAVLELIAESTDAKPVFSGTELTQDSPGVPDRAEAGDLWGASLSSYEDDFAAGAPRESVGAADEAGAVIDRTYGDYAFLTQDTPGMPGTAEDGDRFGKAVEGGGNHGLHIGVPYEDIDGKVDAGMLNSWESGGKPGPSVSQDTPGVSGAAEAGDRFGSALVAYGPAQTDASYRVRVGVPNEDIAGAANAGMVVGLTYYVPNENQPPEFEADGVLSAENTAGAVQENAYYGSALGTGSVGPDADPELYIGVPGYDNGAGTVVRYLADGSSSLVVNIADTPESGDAYGSALVQGPLGLWEQ